MRIYLLHFFRLIALAPHEFASSSLVSPRVNRPVSPPQSTDMCTISFVPYIRVSLPFPLYLHPASPDRFLSPLFLLSGLQNSHPRAAPVYSAAPVRSRTFFFTFDLIVLVFKVSRRRFIPVRPFRYSPALTRSLGAQLRLLKSPVTTGLHFKSHRALLT
jgi:hypothetical protein